MVKSVFISYSTADTATTELIRDGLEVTGIACWMAPRDIAPGQDYAEQIINAIEGCTVLLLVLSETSNHSQYVIKEVERAIAKHKIVIPFRIHNIQPSRSLEFFISNAQWIDALDRVQQVVPILLSAIQQHLYIAGKSTVEASSASTADEVKMRHNLSAQTTGFVGRAKELADLARLLADPTVRLVTVVGPGGMGKTRLALAAGEAQWQHQNKQTLIFSDAANTSTPFLYPDGIFFVALAPLRSADEIVTSIAEAIDFQMESGRQTRTPEQLLLDYLRQKQMLLILDNFEHVLEGAGLIAKILQDTSNVNVLATSRERLQLRHEHIYAIQGLEYPDSDTPEDANGYGAMQLFIQCAQRVRQDFTLRADDLAVLTRICSLVGGMPLGLELAAGWVDMLSLADIMAEIQASLDILETSARDVPERQRSIRAVFDTSWSRMNDAEREIFPQLSVFRGGFSRQAVQAVTGASLRTLNSLSHKSLLYFDHDRNRYQIHELLHQYAAYRLALNEDLNYQVQMRHADYFAAYAERPDSKVLTSKEWLVRISLDNDNMRAALSWLLAQREITLTSRVCRSLEWFWFATSRISEGRNWFDKVLTLASDTTLNNHDHAVLTRMAGYFAFFQGDYEPATELFHQSLALFRVLNDQAGVASLLVNLAMVAEAKDDVQNARALFDESHAIRNAIGSSVLIADSLYHKGRLLLLLGCCTDAEEPLKESLALFQANNQMEMVPLVMTFLGHTKLTIGEIESAAQLFGDSLAMKEQQGAMFTIPYDLIGIAGTLGAVQLYVRAAKIIGAADGLAQSSGLNPSPRERELWERIRATVRKQVDDIQYTNEWNQGRACSVLETIDLALAEVRYLNECSRK